MLRTHTSITTFLRYLLCVSMFAISLTSASAQSISGPTSVRVGQTATLSTPGFSSFVLPTGGTITTVGNDRIHTFTSNDTFTTAQSLFGARLLVVGGGGGGGFNGGGGGGAGGYYYNPSLTVGTGTYPVTIGGGGLGSTSASATGATGSATIFGSLVTMPGGGGGATRNLATPGAQGASGGGGAGSGVATSTSCTYSVTIATHSVGSLSVLIDGTLYGTISAQIDETGIAGIASMNFPVKSGQTITTTTSGGLSWSFYNGPNQTGQLLSSNTPGVVNNCTAGGSDNSGSGTNGSKGGKGTPFDAGCLAAGGGGGGAGSAGSNASNDTAGTGGVGLQNAITGTTQWYAAGGGGGLAGYPGCGASTAASPGGAPGGSGVGGNGETTAGAVNTGSGGGAEKNGGSGVVVVRYPLPQWWSSNPSIATVDALTGVVTGVSAGTATINCSYAGNLFSVSFTITAPAPALTITGTTSLCPGKTSDLSSGRPDYVAPTGGIITTIGNERIHTFTASTSFNSAQPIYGARILAIGGGGGGAGGGSGAAGGGGGAGAYVYLTDRDIPSGSQAVTVGAGGVGGVNNGTGSGTATTFVSAFAAGGGFGASEGSTFFAASGGSGGGSSVGGGTKVNGGLGTPGYGYQGGDSVYHNSCTGSGGGGGAGGPGQSGTATGPGMGGLGLQNDISGTALWYAGGGGGYSACDVGAAGGSGVGGIGGVSDGAANTGSGGGGGKNGGSGILIIRYTIPAWTSSNTAVATVNAETGLVTAISPGTTTISYTSFEGNTVSVPVTVATPSIVPTFTQRPPICKNTTLSALPTTSLNGITGTWSPAIDTSQTTTYTFTPTTGQCALPTTMTIQLSETTVWNGTAWSNGAPDGVKSVTFTQDYLMDGDMAACALNVTNNADVKMLSNFILTVQNEITVDPGSTLTLESDANLLQGLTTQVNSNVGNIILKREAFVNRLDYVYWGSPVAGQNLQAFSPATLSNRFYTIDEPTSTFVPINPATNNFLPGKGYVIRAPNNYLDYPLPKQSFMGTFTGVPNNGDYTVTVYKSATNRGYNLVSNPYPSTIDAVLLLMGSNNKATICFYVHQSLLGGGYNYIYYNLTGGTSSPLNIETLGYIQPGQGFLYRPTSAVVNVTFKNSMRVGAPYLFFRTANPDRHRYWLNLKKDDDRMSQLLVGYLPDATDQFDGGYDGALIPAGNYMGVNVEDDVCAIVAKPLPFETESAIPLNLHIEQAGNYSISFDHADGLFDDGQQIYINDTVLGVTHNVTESPYEFLSETGDFPNRLQIVYQQGPTLGLPQNPSKPWDVVVYPANGKLHVEGSSDLKSVRIFDLRGRLLYEKNQIGATTAELDGFLPTGSMVLLKIIGNKGETTKKVVF